MSTLATLAATVLVLDLSRCDDTAAPRTDDGQTEATPAASAASASTDRGPAKTAAASNSSDNTESSHMKMGITIGDREFSADLRDSTATQDLVAQLPVTVNMIDHDGVEKTGPLPAPLSLDGQPDGADPGVGEVGYYPPNGNFVLYYGDQSYFPGIVSLGQMDDDAVQQLADTSGAVTVTVEAN